MTTFLRFPDAATFEATLPAGFVSMGETGAPLPDGVTAMSVIGTIEEGAQWDEAGNLVVEPTVLPGYHVNALGSMPIAWASYVLTPAPATPERVFGDEQ